MEKLNKLAVQLLEEAMANAKEYHPDEPGLHWGWLKPGDEFELGTVGSLHGSVFLFIDQVVDICRACKMPFYLVTCPDLDGRATAAIRIIKS